MGGSQRGEFRLLYSDSRLHAAYFREPCSAPLIFGHLDRPDGELEIPILQGDLRALKVCFRVRSSRVIAFMGVFDAPGNDFFNL